MDDYIVYRRVSDAGRAAEALGLPETSDRMRILRKKLDVMKGVCEGRQLLYKARWLECHLDNTRKVFDREISEHGERIEEEKSEEMGKLRGIAAGLNAFLLLNMGAFFAQFACQGRSILNGLTIVTINIVASFILLKLAETAMRRLERSTDTAKALVHDAIDCLMLCVRDLMARLNREEERSRGS